MPSSAPKCLILLNLVGGWVLPNGCLQKLPLDLTQTIPSILGILNQDAFRLKPTLQRPEVRSKLGIQAFTDLTGVIRCLIQVKFLHEPWQPRFAATRLLLPANISLISLNQDQRAITRCFV